MLYKISPVIAWCFVVVLVALVAGAAFVATNNQSSSNSSSNVPLNTSTSDSATTKSGIDASKAPDNSSDTTDSSTLAHDAIPYANTDYRFSTKFPKAWQGYRVNTLPGKGFSSPMQLEILIPTSGSKDEYVRVATIFVSGFAVRDRRTFAPETCTIPVVDHAVPGCPEGEIFLGMNERYIFEATIDFAQTDARLSQAIAALLKKNFRIEASSCPADTATNCTPTTAWPR